MQELLQFAVSGLVIILLFSFLLRREKLEIFKSGQYLLVMNKLYGALGWIIFLPSLAMVVSPFFYPELFQTFFPTSAICAFLGVILILSGRNHAVRFDSHVIESCNWLGTGNTILWRDIQSISYNSITGTITVVDVYGNKMKVHQHLKGIYEFVLAIEEHTTFNPDELGLPAF